MEEGERERERKRTRKVEILLETVPYSPQSYSLKELRILLLQLRG